MVRVRWMVLLTAVGLAVAVPAAPAADPNEPAADHDKAAPAKGDAAFLNRRAITAATVSALVGGHGLLGDVIVVLQGNSTGAWVDNSAPTKTRPPVPLEKSMLVGIEQRKPVAHGGNPYEAASYNYVLTHAHDVDPKQLQEAGAKNQHVTRAHLMEGAEEYQGEVVRVAGIIRRLRKFDAPKALANDGVKDVYEAWIFPYDRPEPYCVVCTSIPKDMALGEKVSYQVETDGYFFKQYAYKGAEKWLVAPLVVANEIRWPAKPVDNSEVFSAAFIPSVVGGIFGVIALGAGLTFWFRRGDRAVHDRLSSLRQAPPAFSEPTPAEEAPAPRE